MKKIILILFLIPTLLLSQKKQLKSISDVKQDDVVNFNILIEKLNSTFGGDFSIDAQYFSVNGTLSVNDGVGPRWVFGDWTNDDLKKLTTKELYDRISKDYKLVINYYSKGFNDIPYDSPDGNNLDQDYHSPKYIEMKEKWNKKRLRIKEIQSIDFSISNKLISKISESDYLKMYEQYIFNLDSIEISKYVKKRGYSILEINSNDYRNYDVKLSDKLTSNYDFSSRPKPDYREFLIYKKDQVNERIKKEVEKVIENSFDIKSFVSYFFDVDGPNFINTYYNEIYSSYEKNSEFYSNGISNDRETIGEYTLKLRDVGKIMSLKIEVENLFSNNKQYYINNINIGSDYMKVKIFHLTALFYDSFIIPPSFEYIAVLSQNTLKNYSKPLRDVYSKNYQYFNDLYINGFNLSKKRYFYPTLFDVKDEYKINERSIIDFRTLINDHRLAKFCRKIYYSDLTKLHSRVLNYLLVKTLLGENSVPIHKIDDVTINTKIIKETNEIYKILIQLGNDIFTINNSIKTSGVFDKPSFKNSLNQSGSIYKRYTPYNKFDIGNDTPFVFLSNTLTESNFPNHVIDCREEYIQGTLEKWCLIQATEPDYQAYGLNRSNYIGWNQGQQTFNFTSKFKEHSLEKYNSEPIIINNSVLNLFVSKKNKVFESQLLNLLKRIPIPIEKLREAKKQMFKGSKKILKRLIKSNDIEILDRLKGSYLFNDYEKVELELLIFKNYDDLLKFINKNIDDKYFLKNYKNKDIYYLIDYDTNSLYIAD